VAKYLVSVSYTDEGARGLRKDGGTKREHAARMAAESLGGKLEAFYFAFGEDDVVVIVDFPDAISVAALSVAIGSTGAARCRTTPLLTPEDMDKAVSKNTAYRAPGKD
jgi:uncharacterized protein with GYD domain